MSNRFGDANKLLADVDGVPMVRHTANVYLAAGLQPVVVVVGHQAKEVIEVLRGLDVQTILNPNFVEGQSRSLVAGLRALPAEVEAAVLGVADQPFLGEGTLRELVKRFREGGEIVVPRYGGQQGSPVLMARRVLPRG